MRCEKPSLASLGDVEEDHPEGQTHQHRGGHRGDCRAVKSGAVRLVAGSSKLSSILHDVLEQCPPQEREDRIIETQKCEPLDDSIPLVCREIVARSGGRDQHKRHRKGQEKHRHEHLAGAAGRGQARQQRSQRGDARCRPAAAPRSAPGSTAPRPCWRKNSQNSGTATTCTAARNTKSEHALAAHMIRAVDRRAPAARPRSRARAPAANARASASMRREHHGAQSIADGRPRCRRPAGCRPARSETSTNTASTNTTIAGTTSRPRSSSTRSLRTSARKRRSRRHPPRARPAPARVATPANHSGSWVATSTVRPRPRRAPRAARDRPSLVERGRRLVEQQHRRGRAAVARADRQPLPHAPRDSSAARSSPRRASPTRSSAGPTALAVDAVQRGVQLQVLA